MGGPDYKVDRTPETDLAGTVYLIRWALAKGKSFRYGKPPKLADYRFREAWELGMDKRCFRAMRQK